MLVRGMIGGERTTSPKNALSGEKLMFKTILVPVDLGEVETAKPAIDKAVELPRPRADRCVWSMCAPSCP